MRKRSIALVGTALCVVGIACAGKKSSNGPSGPLTADLGGAVAVALRPETSVPQAHVASAVATPTPPSCSGGSDLVKIDAAGNVTPVLNEPFSAAYLTTTSNNLLVTGLGYVSTSDGSASLWCCLLAIPRASGSVRCLVSEGLGGQLGSSNLRAHGVATRGNEVFFVQDNASAGKAELLRWDGSSDQRELLVQLSRGSFLEPMAVAGKPNVCVLGGTHGICGNPDTNTYQTSPADGLPLLIGETVFVAVFPSAQTISLADLSVVRLGGTGGGDFPDGTSPLVPTADGGILAIGGTSKPLIKVVPPDTIAYVDTSHPWQFLIGAQNYAFAYGANDLRRIDLGTTTVGTSNLLSSVNMLEVTSMWFTAPEILRIDGTAANGMATSVFLDAVTGDLTTQTTGSDRFTTIISVQ